MDDPKSPKYCQDESDRTKSLFSFFCQNLHLGQWELAHTCIQDLSKSDASVKDLLKSVVLYPYDQSNGSQFIKNPHQLSWLCLQAYREVAEDAEETESVEIDVHFRLLLVEACFHTTSDIVKELYLFHRRLHMKTSRQIDYLVPKLSEECIAFLKNLMLEKPSLCHSFLQALSVINEPVHFQHNQELQSIYLDCLQGILHRLCRGNPAAILCKDDCRYCKIVSDIPTCDNLTVKFYQILSLYNPHDSTDEELYRNLFRQILDVSYNGDNILQLDMVYSCLLGRTSACLVEAFAQLDNERRFLGSSTTGAATFLQFCNDMDRLKSWKNIYLLCIKQKQHFFDSLMQSAIHLIQQGEFEQLQSLLEPPEFQVLKPLVLLLGWNHCYSCSNANKLLTALWGQNDSIQHDPVVEQACKKLLYQVDLVQWCLEKAKPLLIASGASMTHHDRATEMFQGLEAHSVLYVLHQSTQLSTLDMEEVLEILHKRPVLMDECSSKVQTKPKTVRFSEKSDSPEKLQKVFISIEQERDIAIYRSYCALKHFMDAMYFCADSSNFMPRKQSVLNNHGNDLESQGQGESGNDFQHIYDMFVTRKLIAGKEQVSKLHPLSYRVETLENIFSLLFMMQEDVQEVAVLCTDSGEDMPEDPNCSIDCADSAMQSLDSTLHSLESTYEKVNETELDEEKFTMISNKLWRISKLKSESDLDTSANVDNTSVEAGNVCYDEPFMNSVDSPKDQKKQQKERSSTPGCKSSTDGKSEMRNHPEDLSNFSTGSTSSSYKIGFIANQYIVRDFIAMLNECLLELDGAMYRLIGEKIDTKENLETSSSIQKALNLHMKCTVSEDNLQARISRLRQYVSEAQWRFQVVSHDQIPNEPGNVLSTPVKEEAADISDDDLDVSLFHDEVVPPLVKSSSGRTRGGSLEKVFSHGGRVSGRESESQVTTDPGGSGVISPGASQHRHKRRVSTRRESSSSSVVSKTKHGIIPYMLGSHQSLLTMCLRRGHFAQANQIVKLFKLEDTTGVIEMAFAEQYQAASRKLQAIDPRRRSSMPGVPGARAQSNRFSMRAIENVAAAGEATMMITNIVDEVISSSALELYPENIQADSIVHKSALLTHLNPENIPTMVVLDLACTACRTWEASENLLAMGHKRLSGEANTNRPRSMSGADMKRHSPSPDVEAKKTGASPNDLIRKNDVTLKGVEPFLTQLWTLMSQATREGISVSDEMWSSYLRNSVTHILTNVTFPLDVAGFRTYMATLFELEKSCSKVEKAFIEVKAMEQKSFLSKGAEKKASRPVIHIAMKRLLQVFEKVITSQGVLVHFERNTESIIEPTRNYLQNLYDHVKTFCHLIMENEPKQKDAPSLTQNYYVILDESPTNILGKLMFEKKISPYKLEAFAQRLSLDLLHIIVNSCCPRIPSKQMITSQNAVPMVAQCEHGRVVLNASSNLKESTRSPDVVAREIMTRIVKLLKEFSSSTSSNYVNQHTVTEILKERDLAAIFDGVGELAVVDLNKLTSSSEKRSFCANVINLLTIHSLFYQVHIQKLSLHNMTPLERLNALCTFSYHIGQLGRVSLLELRFLISRNGLPSPTCYNKVLVNRLYGLDQHDPWTIFGPPPEPRLLFLLIDGSYSSPPLQVVSSELVSQQVEMAMESYLEDAVKVHEEEKKVTLPEMLLWYRLDFVGKKGDSYLAEYEGLVNFVAEHSPSGLSGHLKDMLHLDDASGFGEIDDGTRKRELPFKVTIEPYSWDFVIRFDYTPIRLHHKLVQQHRRGSSLPIDLEGCKSEYLPNVNTQVPKVYNLRAVTLDYMKARCTLVSTLLSLICSDEIDDIEENFDDIWFDSSSLEKSSEKSSGTPPPVPRKRTGSDISLVDVRSYRYQKLSQNFPILSHHVQENVIPLAGALQEDIANHGDPILKLLSMSIRGDIRECMLMMSSSPQFCRDVNNILNELVQNKKWLTISHVLTSLPEFTLSRNPEWTTLRDFSLCCCTKEGTPVNNSPQSRMMSWRFLQQISDPDTQVRAVLGTLKMWSVTICLELLGMCQSLQNIEARLKRAVEIQLEAMKLYQKIIECAKTLQIKLSMRTRPEVPPQDEYDAIDFEHLEQLMTWQGVVHHSKQTPEEILKVLVKCQEFKTLRQWAEIHNVGPIMKQNTTRLNVHSIEESYVVYLLEEEKPKPMDAYIALEDISKSDGELCRKICDNLLSRLKNEKNILFVARFMLQHLDKELDADRRNELYLICMGAKILLYLPERSRIDYLHLRSAPMLIFEQLLMNMKVDWAGQCIEIIKKDLNAIPHKVSGCALDALDEMITIYAKHALEFPVSQVEPPGPVNASPTMSGRSSASPMTSIISDEDRDKVSTLGEPLKPAALLAALAGRRGSRQFLTSTGTRPGSTPLKESPLARHMTLNTGSSFIMPVEPPTKDKWVPDGRVSECMVCQTERFSMFNRRHHCRRCGRVVCASCSTKTTPIRGQLARTCDDCYDQIYKPRGSFNEHDFYQQRVMERLSGASPSGSYTKTPPLASFGGEKADIQLLVQSLNYFWKLEMNEEVDTVTREDFYYEQSPSTSLCISILDLHSNPKVCGEQMLQLCDELSKLLKPIAPGVANPEVDYNFVISMMKYLLINAKLKFLKCNEPQGEGLCEIYQSKVDLLNLLVSNNCKDILSIQELTKSDTVRRLRDRLIEDERLSLAMEVSTKCGIDPSGVWAAWGIGCLQSGNYQEAREKFSRCLKVPVDRNQNQTSSKLLSDIVECIEKLPSTGAGGVKCLLAQLSLSENLTAEPLKQYTDDSTMDEHQFKECLFYLKTYGTHMAIIAFFRRHGFWQKAVKYILDKKCSADVFVEGLLVPAIQTGDLGKLQDQLAMIDSSLAPWHPYLTACCRYLNRMKYYNMLYQFQLFMKDYIRAAMTCITTFFSKGALTQTELRGRLQHLLNAKQHFEMYLTQTKYSGASSRNVPDWGKSGASAIRLSQSAAEVQMHLRTVDLQIEVTQFLYQCQTDGAMKKQHEYPPGHVPTLFGDNKRKGEVATTILLSEGKFSNAFTLALRIIQDYRLGATVIFSQVGRQLAKQQQYGVIRQLLGKINEINICDDASYDEVIGACVRVIADDSNEGREAESLIKMTKLDTNKINAYMLCGKLKSAYLIAVRRNNEEDIQRIAGAAQRAGQSAMYDICQKWLKQKQKK
ncbi:zinc finger FYVE domain-containing protein 26-like isoform X2 [Lineus longissimus]|uniref:zinc finger FYVE domain-containing protein 26-like isoform X2 n=1 Tax=Lineus longissimus TaxID=88925 RepID=UPI002B4E873D